MIGEGEEVWKGKVGELIKDALRCLPYLFCYMHPFPVSLTIDKSNSRLELKRRSGFWKFLPWLISVLLITGVAGLGSCSYVVFSYAFRLPSTLHIRMLDVMISTGLGIFAATELGVMLTSSCFPELVVATNRLAELERRCKYFIIFIPKPKKF